MKEVRQYKQLKSQLDNLVGDSEVMKIDIANKQREYATKQQSIAQLKAEMDKLNGKENLKVSEHAMVRFFERVSGIDIEQIERRILTDEVIALVEKLGGTGTFNCDGFSVVIKNYTVVTIK